MKLGIFSDLHTEFSPYVLPKQDVAVYINAGDLHPDPRIRENWNRGISIPMVSVLGNHDFYRGIFPKPGENQSVTILPNGMVVASATLWTDLSDNFNWYLYTKNLVDSRLISGMTHELYMECHRADKEFLLNSNADIIVSHHAPSFSCVHPRYFGSPVNCCFSTELSQEILNHPRPPKIWIYGHMHDKNDFMIGDTRLISNPRGYPGEFNYKSYEPMVVEI